MKVGQTMKSKLYQKMGIAIVVMLCLCSTAMAAESDLGPARTSEALRQRYVTGQTYHQADESYTPEVGDTIFYDVDQDGIADGNGVVYTVGDVATIGSLSFDCPSAVRGLRSRLQDWVMGYGKNQTSPGGFGAPIAPDFVFI